jgi:decaprenylphospho-beta-D-ribofuranose 2-oxidase
MSLAGWGRSSTAAATACRPERVSEIREALRQTGAEGIISHGGGRSYGDAALNSGGRAILTGRLDRLLAFDRESGLLVAEPGVTFETLMQVFMPRGFMAPVAPGTAFATLGGAVANDVHGKNHDRAGSFGNHVAWVDLMLPSGAIIRASSEEEPELFDATVGGIGLTGVIVSLGLRLVAVPSAAVVVREERMPDLDAFMAALLQARDSASYSVGWIDALARGASLGRGLLQTAEPALDGATAEPRKRTRSVPVEFPNFALNSLGIQAFNRWHYSRVPPDGRERIVPWETFLYPLDSLHNWNRIYGRRGFYQFQCVLPEGAGAAGLRALLGAITEARSASFLAVLKTLGSEGRGFLSFAQRGWTLALDFPRTHRVTALMSRLERITLDHGGRIYLAKDALLSPAGFRAMYPALPHLQTVLEAVDPDGVMASDLSRRLRIREAA